MTSLTNYLVVHGSYGSPSENWFPWLKTECEKDRHQVVVPQFPTPHHQTLEAWEAVAAQALHSWDPRETVLVGHSTGALLVLRLAEKAPLPYRAVFSVCPFASPLGSPQFDPLNESFIRRPFDWARVKAGASQITCFAGDNDPYVPLSYSKDVAREADAVMVVIEKGGHLNAESGYRQFPQLLDLIRQGSHNA
jgi:predicted alpha/beta hydrolase family esterase